MSTYELNEKALALVSIGEFEEGQALLRLNCKSGDYRAFHNLGLYYIENGITLKNQKIISGYSLGRRYIGKANRLNPNPHSSAVLARYAYSYEHDPEKALNLYKEIGQGDNDTDVNYNMASCLYELKRYEEALDRLNGSSACDSMDAKLLFYFALYYADECKFKAFINEHGIFDAGKDNIDLTLVLSYFYNANTVSPDAIERYLNDWSPDEYMWAVIIEALLANEISDEDIKKLAWKNVSGYANENKNYQRIGSLIASAERRYHVIHSGSYFHPLLREQCGYFGCQEHQTSW